MRRKLVACGSNKKKFRYVGQRSVPSFKHRKHDHVWATDDSTYPVSSIEHEVSYRQLLLPFFNN